MKTTSNSMAFILGFFIFLGLAALGFQVGKAAIEFKQLERVVTVKGLAEKEVAADLVIWPIQFINAHNDLQALYESIDENTNKIKAFLHDNNIAPNDITVPSPAITDKSAHEWGSDNRAEFRYSATQTVTVHSEHVAQVRFIMTELSELGRHGIVLMGGNYDAQTEYIYTQLNDIKPEMIEEATRNARESATKFAEDSQSELGKIRRASQGQFSISPRDRNNPHIMNVRVVSTIEYYLSD